MTYQLVREGFEFDTSHRLMKHGGKCHSPHGHRYKVVVTVSGGSLDDVGVVVDFGVIKLLLGAWINLHWDHTIILEAGDPLITAMYAAETPSQGAQYVKAFDAHMMHPEPGCAAGANAKPCYIVHFPPTAENLAKYLFEVVLPEIFKKELAQNKFRLDNVEVWETPNCMCRWPAMPSMQDFTFLREELEYLRTKMMQNLGIPGDYWLVPGTPVDLGADVFTCLSEGQRTDTPVDLVIDGVVYKGCHILSEETNFGDDSGVVVESVPAVFACLPAKAMPVYSLIFAFDEYLLVVGEKDPGHECRAHIVEMDETRPFWSEHDQVVQLDYGYKRINTHFEVLRLVQSNSVPESTLKLLGFQS